VVGYELYCSLLEAAVQQLKKLSPKETVEVDVQLPGDAYLPRTYVPDMRLKIDLYRRLARVATTAELADFRAELVDRFGQPPPTAEHLLDLAEVRVAAHRWRIDTIHLEEPYMVFTYQSVRLMHKLASSSGGKLRVVDGRSAYLPLDHAPREPKSLLKEAKSLLQSE
jgi:transcription-repair coupling factor (superfamily II helicase)